MATSKEWNSGPSGRGAARFVFKIALGVCVVAATVASAVLTKEMSGSGVPMAAVVSVPTGEPAPVTPRILSIPEMPVDIGQEPVAAAEEPVEDGPALDAETAKFAADPSVRWFNGRPVRPAKKFWMTVTGYSPDERSCGDSADGLTATLHSVETNNFKLVAADPTLLPYGSMITVPGYAQGEVVPVLDCGGAIKGRRLDLLYPTHEQARKWGRQRVLVTIWEYADGKPAENPRKVR